MNNVDGEVCDSAPLIGGNSLARPSAENDPSWYASDPQLLVDAFSIPTVEKLGCLFMMMFQLFQLRVHLLLNQ